MNNSFWNLVHFPIDFSVMITLLSCHKLTHEAIVPLISDQVTGFYGMESLTS